MSDSTTITTYKSSPSQIESASALLIPFDLENNRSGIDADGPLGPILKTGGLVFPYTPSIQETISIKYDQVDLVHSNEAYYAYKNTENRRIELSNCFWTCDTLDNAKYALAVLHFFRSYSLMDFGSGATGRPPSPMWFFAYGNYAFNQVPCLLEGGNPVFPNDIDYVGIPNPGTDAALEGTLGTNRSATNATQYTWMPIKFEISGIRLIVQHSPQYWLGFNLANYKNGTLLAKSRTQVAPPVAPTVPNIVQTPVTTALPGVTDMNSES